MEPKIFEVDNQGETDWVMGMDQESVMQLLRDEMDYEDDAEVTITELPFDQFGDRHVYEIDENNKGMKVPFTDVYRDHIELKTPLPVYIAGTVFFEHFELDEDLMEEE